MEHLIELTEWETGEVVLIDPDSVVLCERLAAEVYELGNDVHELGARTKLIVPPQQIILVRETPAEIRVLASQLTKAVKP